MEAYKCDDCGCYFEAQDRDRSTYYMVRDGVGSFYQLKGTLDLCDKCWDKMLKKVFADLKVGHDSS